MELLFLIIFNSNHFMEIQNKNKQEEFTTLKNFKVHNTEFTDVCAQLVTINGKIYVGLQRKSYFEENIIHDSRASSFQLKLGRRS